MNTMNSMNNVNFMTPEELMRVLSDSNAQSVNGELNINGMSIKLIKSRNKSRQEGHQR